MADENGWCKRWTVLASDGPGKDVIAPGSAFTLEPKPTSEEPAYYRLSAGRDLHGTLDGTLLYPVGVRGLTVRPLKKWDPKKPDACKQYMSAAKKVKKDGRGDALAARLEGAFTGPEGTLQALRIYRFTGVRPVEKRDWVVVDIVSPKKKTSARAIKAMAATAGDGDGTGHGDG
jgi:hypothetical protein